MRKASITIFASLSMTLVATMLFSLLEIVRYHELAQISQLQTELALESTFANYNVNLWEKYHLLGRNTVGMEEQIREISEARNSANKYGLNLFQAGVKDVSLNAYTRITDGNGATFVQAVSSYMKKDVLFDTIQNLYNQYEVIKFLKDGNSVNRSKIDEALQSIEEIQKQLSKTEVKTDETTGHNTGIKETGVSKIANPLELIKNLQQRGVLELVIAEGDMLSEKEIAQNGIVSKRDLQKGVKSQIPESSWIDRVLFQQYLLSYFSNYLNVKENTCLSYEVEYIIGGKTKDIENLEQVAQQLLGIREIINFLYLISDIYAQEEAGGIAIALAGATANPMIIEVVKIGILTAWAFGESVLDVRALFCGKKIPFLKSRDTWTLALSDFAQLGNSNFIAKESNSGIGYQDYLGILLLFQKENELSMHAMDLQEIYIRNVCGEADFRMDELSVHAGVSIEYAYHPVFVYFHRSDPPYHSINTEARFSYN